MRTASHRIPRQGGRWYRSRIRFPIPGLDPAQVCMVRIHPAEEACRIRIPDLHQVCMVAGRSRTQDLRQVCMVVFPGRRSLRVPVNLRSRLCISQTSTRTKLCIS